MYYYYNALQTKSGDVLPDYLVRLFTSPGGDAVDIFADDSGTPIATASGVANAAKADSLGMVRFWVPSGTYDIAQYDTTDTFKGKETGVPLFDAGALTADLSADTGAALVGTDGGDNVQEVLDAANSAIALRPTSAALAAPTGGEMVGFEQDVTGSVARTAQSKFAEILSLKDFGAVGDGTTDDTAAVQAALTNGGGSLFVPRGVYIVDTVTGSNIYLHGPGTIRKKSATKGIMLNLSGSNRIEGVTLDYNWASADSSPPNFGNITVEQNQGSLDLVGVKFIRSYDAAVYNSGASLNVDSGCSFTGGAPHNGLTSGNERPTYYVFCIADASTVNQVINIGEAYFEGSSLVAANLHLNPTGIFITSSGVDGFRFKAINISNPRLIGCTTNAGNGNITGAIDLYNGADNIVISGATIRYFTYAGIKVQNSSYFSIVGNTITDGSVPAGAHTGHANGIVTIEKARGSTVEQKFGVISGNIISGCTYSGITNNCDFVSITDNVINGVALAGGIATGVNNDASYVVISGNQGTDVLGVQILTAGDHVRVTGNTMSSGTGAADTALRFSGDDVLIDGNSFVSGTTAASTGIRTNGPASNIRISGNYVDGYPYGIDIRTGSGAVDEIVRGPNQFANISIGDYNLGGAVTNATLVSTAAWT